MSMTGSTLDCGEVSPEMVLGDENDATVERFFQMAFQSFRKNDNDQQLVRSSKSRENLPWAMIEANGETSYIMHFGTEAIDLFNLSPGDTVDLSYDSKTQRIGVHVLPDGDHRLTMHGGSRRRLKVSCTKFYNHFLAEVGLTLPHKMTISMPRAGSKLTLVVEVAERTRKPRSDAGQLRGPYKTKAEPTPVPVKQEVRRSRNKRNEVVA